VLQLNHVVSEISAVDDRPLIGDALLPLDVCPFGLADGRQNFVGECCVLEEFPDLAQWEGDVVEANGQGVVISFSLALRCSVDQFLAKFGERGLVDCLLKRFVTERVVGDELVQELRADLIGREVIAEDDMVVDSAQVGVGAAELVEAQLDDRENEIEVLQPSVSLGVEDALVPIDEEVIVDSNDLEIGRQPLQICEEPFPSLVPASVLLEMAVGSVDVEVPSTPPGAAGILPVRRTRDDERFASVSLER